MLDSEVAKLGSLHTEAKRAIEPLKVRRYVLAAAIVMSLIDIRTRSELEELDA